MNEPGTISSSPFALEMRGVAAGSMRDPNNIVVEQVQWTVSSGDYWAIGGLQGSGKSDFLLMAAGLMAPSRGTYHFFGQSMPLFEEHELRERLRLGMVFDGGQLFNHLTISENVALPLRYHRNLSLAEAGPELAQMLSICELQPYADSTPGALARNWQKRVGLARALMIRPEVLLLDNPLGGLDLRHRAWWLALLGQLSKGHPWMKGRPITLIVTADDLRPWRASARQFAVLKNKRLLILGNRAQLEAAGDEMVQELLAIAPADG